MCCCFLDIRKTWFSYVADIAVEVHCQWLLMSEILCDFFTWTSTDNESLIIDNIWEPGFCASTGGKASPTFGHENAKNFVFIDRIRNDTRKVKVLSLPETIKQNSTFRAKALRQELAVGVREKPRVFLYELIQKHHVTK